MESWPGRCKVTSKQMSVWFREGIEKTPSLQTCSEPTLISAVSGDRKKWNNQSVAKMPYWSWKGNRSRRKPTIFKDIFGHTVGTFQDIRSSREVLLVFTVLGYRLYSYRLSELVALPWSEKLNTTTLIVNAWAILERVETFLKQSTIANKKEFSPLVHGADRNCCLLLGFWSSVGVSYLCMWTKPFKLISFHQGKKKNHVMLVRIPVILIFLFGQDKLLQGHEWSTVWPRWLWNGGL